MQVSLSVSSLTCRAVLAVSNCAALLAVCRALKLKGSNVPCCSPICFAAMANAVDAYVYDYIIIDAGATIDTLNLPGPGDIGWKALPLRQVERICQRDHMVLYLTNWGSSYPFKLKEAQEDMSLMLYERRGDCECVVKRTPKAPTASCMQKVGTCNNIQCK